MGILMKRRGAPVGSFEELAARADYEACKRENEREDDERAAINLATLYDLLTLRKMLAIVETRSRWVSRVEFCFAVVAVLLLLLWWVLALNMVHCWITAAAIVAMSLLLRWLYSDDQRDRQLIERAIRMREEEERRAAGGGEGSDYERRN